MANSSTPLITIRDENNKEITTPWNVETLDVNNGSSIPQSSVKTILIWNNYNSTYEAADLVGTNITTKNINGDNLNEQLVIDKWVQADYNYRRSTTGSESFASIGGEDVLEICADGASGVNAENHVISGTSNSGTSVDTTHFATVKMKVVPKINALKGLHQFKVRISGYYT